MCGREWVVVCMWLELAACAVTRFAIESAPICSSFAFSPVDSSSTVAEPGVQSRRSAATRRPSNMVVAQDKVLALGSKWLLRKTRSPSKFACYMWEGYTTAHRTQDQS